MSEYFHLLLFPNKNDLFLQKIYLKKIVITFFHRFALTENSKCKLLLQLGLWGYL